MKYSKGLFAFSVLLILALGIFLRCAFPEADAPLGLSFSQGIHTDGSWYYNNALASTGNQYEDPGLSTIYNRPFITQIASLHFHVFGTSLAAFNLVSLFPGILALLLGLLCLRQNQFSKSMQLIFLGILATNFILVMYSRVPIIYIWMIVFIWLPCLAWDHPLKPTQKAFGYLIYLLFTAWLVLNYKFMVLFFLACHLLAIGLFSSNKLFSSEYKKRNIWISVLSLLIILIAVNHPSFHFILQQTISRISIFKSQIGSLQDFYQEMHRFWIIGFRYVYGQNLLLFLLAYFACLLIVLGRLIEWPIAKNQKIRSTDLYMTLVFILGQGVIMFFSYRPIRFWLFLIPSATYLFVRFFTLLPEIQKGKLFNSFQKTPKISYQIIIFFWLFPILFLMGQTKIFQKLELPFVNHLILLGFMVPILSFVIMRAMLWAIQLFINENVLGRMRSATRIICIAFPIFIIVIQNIFPWISWSLTRQYTIQQGIEDAEEIFTKNSLVTGPYAHVLSLNAPWKAERFFPDKINFQSRYDVMIKRGITHFALNAQHDLNLVQQFPEIYSSWTFLERFMIRGHEVLIYRIQPDNPVSLFEKAHYAFARGKLDQSLSLLDLSIQEYPLSATSSRAKMKILLSKNPHDPSDIQILKQAIERNPEHPLPWIFQAILEQRQNLDPSQSLTHAFYLSGSSRFYKDMIRQIYNPTTAKPNP